MIGNKKTIQFGNHTLVLETGIIARQADAAVMVSLDDTVVLATVVGQNRPDEVKDFVPLTCDHTEKEYGWGTIPGNFFKREGRPTERETLISRLIDRPLRPLFPEGFGNEVQVVTTVLSFDPEIESDIPAIIAASAALALSGIPFNGIVGAARVGYVNGQYVLNPTQKELENSSLDLVVAGTESSILMVESEAKELPEDIMLGAVMFGHRGFQPVIQAIKELAKECSKPAWVWSAPVENKVLSDSLKATLEREIVTTYQIQDKANRYLKLKEIKAAAIEKFSKTEQNPSGGTASEVKNILENLESAVVRGRILTGEKRIDGRDTKTVRPITIKLGLLPRTHGSVLFTRGETQAIVVATLGTKRDAQVIVGPFGEYKDGFMLHYNFPPYSVGEVGRMGTPKRREIGHGRLAKRSMVAMLPDEADFPYVMRVVSEITESNGSSSMASVCGASLALMDAGVPLKAPVAGIAMGLIKEGDRYAVLTDILGDEDHLGDMDFKVAGTSNGITALQMDIKIDGITEEIMKTALHQAQEGRIHILGVMNQALAAPREALSEYAPQIFSFHINPDKIRDVIGKGGATIRALTEETGTSIDIQDDGTVQIASVGRESGLEARRRIEELTAEAEVGRVYEGTVVRLADFGAFVNILPGRDGLVHISQIAEHRVENVSDELHEGQVVSVKVLEIDRQGRVRLSMRELAVETPHLHQD